MALLRTAARLWSAELGLERGPADLSTALLQKRDAREFLSGLVDRHRSSKADGPWIEIVGNRVHVLTPGKGSALSVRPRSYRLDAYGQMLLDLEMI